MFLRIDHENQGEQFWSNIRMDVRINEDGRSRRDVPCRRKVLELIERGEVVVHDHEEKEIWSFLEGVEGWSDDAPEFAKTPVIVTEE